MAPRRRTRAEASKAAATDSVDDERSDVVAKETSQMKPQKPDPKHEEIKNGDKSISCLRYHPFSKPSVLIFTHGAGGTLAAVAMVNFAAGFNDTKSLLYFQGTMNLKGRTNMFHAVIEHEGKAKALGGRSMGARAAVMAAQSSKSVEQLVLVSYPLKNEKGDIRDQILLDLKAEIDVLFISGTEDKMCEIEELNAVRDKMKAKSWLVVVQGADHGTNVKPKKASDEIGRLTGKLAAEWLENRQRDATERLISFDATEGKASEGEWRAKEGSGAENEGGQPVHNRSADDTDQDMKSKPKRRKRN